MRAIDPATMRRLMLHEARVHAVPGRHLRDLGDAILLHDDAEPEPFWNRLESVRWSADTAEFDRRLTEVLLIFASLGRQPHIWASPLHDAPIDLVGAAEGERISRPGCRQPDGPRGSGAGAPGRFRADPGGRDGRAPGSVWPMRRPNRRRQRIVDVLLEAFDVESERRPGVEAETMASLAHPWFTHYLVRLDDRPAAVARRATFEGASYLSSIGTAGWARGRGLGSLVTRLATLDGLAADSEWVYLGVFADNTPAIGIYERSGFVRVGESCPDLLLV